MAENPSGKGHGTRLNGRRTAWPAALACVLAGMAGAADVPADGSDTRTLAERLCAGFEAIDTIACRIEKTTVADDRTVRMVSHVAYRRPRRLHVRITEPAARRVVMDGLTLYYYEAGAPCGFSRPIDDLQGPWTEAALNIPATPMEHLRRLRTRPETPLAPPADGGLCAGYAGEKGFAVLTVDAQGRLHAIAVYASPERRIRRAAYRYADFVAAGPHCWIPRRHDGTLTLPDGETVRETRLVHDLRINTPIPETRFDASRFFTNVTFSTDFRDTYDPPAGR
ncbi:MAG: hypothetical protein JW951_07650 [Lentisphaerae bacterium]|nr:hypothetical protein [Lentisphaerota bacterium]